MPLAEQGLDTSRYSVIPRSLVLLREGERFLLLRGAAHKIRWAGKYNGLGGHIERGEDVAGSAAREVAEECGLQADLWLCGTVLVDTGPQGICLFVFTGTAMPGRIIPSPEGTGEWVEYARISSLPAPDDLWPIVQRVYGMKRGAPPFSARSGYDEAGSLRIVFN